MPVSLVLRNIKRSDALLISEAFRRQGWDKPASQYEQYFTNQESGERDVIVAELEGVFAGYLTIRWRSEYVPFRTAGIPEIVDFNVLKKFQRRGIGSQLMDEAERRIKLVGDRAGIGFGLYQDYGAAQILYIKRGYIPDGNGINRGSTPLQYGDVVTIDDGVVFFLVKEL